MTPSEIPCICRRLWTLEDGKTVETRMALYKAKPDTPPAAVVLCARCLRVLGTLNLREP